MTDSMYIISKTAIEYIRSKPEMYLPASAEAIGTKLAELLLVDALALGAEDVRIARSGEWYAVAADFDWLKHGKDVLGISELFERAIPLPEAGVNSIRHEVVVAAFACDVLTSANNEIVIISEGSDTKASAVGLALCERFAPLRVVAFRCQADDSDVQCD
jgi:hypothetical protein